MSIFNIRRNIVNSVVDDPTKRVQFGTTLAELSELNHLLCTWRDYRNM